LFRIPEGERVMNTYGGDKGDGGLWSVDAGKVPTRFVAVKPKEVGIHTTLHVISNTGEEVSFFLQEVTGSDTQFDAEVDAESSSKASSETAAVKWVPADEANSCKLHSEVLKADVAEAAKKADEKVALELAEYREAYPAKLFFGYSWDDSKAERLGFIGRPFSDDKFTYIRGNQVLALYEINEDGKPGLIQYKYEKGLYTIPKIVNDGYLAIGTKKQNKLTFHRERNKA
jgi:type IV secretion system protein VirB9